MGRIVYKKPQEIERMRAAGHLASKVLAVLQRAVTPGICTQDLDRIAYDLIVAHGATPSFLRYRGFPASICSSLNEQVVHGIPSRTTRLRAGDLIKIDVGVRLQGYHGDSAISVPVGKVSPEVERLLRVTREALWKGIAVIRRRGRLIQVSRAIQEHVERHGFSIVREMVGHGIGRRLHEEPQIPNYVDARQANPALLEGMTLAIEPMVNLGGPEIKTLPDKWTVVAIDGKPSAHFEHTVAVTRSGYEVLTLGPHDPGP